MRPAADFYDPVRKTYFIRTLYSDSHVLQLKGCDNNVLVILDWLEHARPNQEVTQSEVAAMIGITARGLRICYKRLQKMGLIEDVLRPKVPPKVLVPEGFRWVEYHARPFGPKLFAPDSQP
jgi:hypothetical protein